MKKIKNLISWICVIAMLFSAFPVDAASLSPDGWIADLTAADSADTAVDLPDDADENTATVEPNDSDDNIADIDNPEVDPDEADNPEVDTGEGDDPEVATIEAKDAGSDAQLPIMRFRAQSWSADDDDGLTPTVLLDDDASTYWNQNYGIGGGSTVKSAYYVDIDLGAVGRLSRIELDKRLPSAQYIASVSVYVHSDEEDSWPNGQSVTDYYGIGANQAAIDADFAGDGWMRAAITVDGMLPDGGTDPEETQTVAVVFDSEAVTRYVRVKVGCVDDGGALAESALGEIRAYGVAADSAISPFGAGVLSAPQNLALTAATSYSVALSWDAPEFTYSANAIKYIVAYTQAGGDVVTMPETTGTTCEVKYLSSATPYDVKVYAVQDGATSQPAKATVATDEPDEIWDFEDVMDSGIWTLPAGYALGNPLSVQTNSTRVLAVKTGMTDSAPGNANPAKFTPNQIIAWLPSGTPAKPSFNEESGNTFLRLNVQSGNSGSDVTSWIPNLSGKGELAFQFRTSTANNNGLFIQLRQTRTNAGQTRTEGRRYIQLLFDSSGNIQFGKCTDESKFASANAFSYNPVKAKITPNEWETFRFLYDFTGAPSTGTLTCLFTDHEGVVTDLGAVTFNAYVDAINTISFGGSSVIGARDIDDISFGFQSMNPLEPVNPGAVTDITVTARDGGGSPAQVGVGSTLDLLATITPASAYNAEVVWHSDDALVATVDENGRVTGVAVGTAEITAESGAVSGAFTVNVSSDTPTVSIGGKAAVGEWLHNTLQLSAAAQNHDSGSLTWSASPDGWVSLAPENDGRNVTVTALKDGVPAGGLTITVKAGVAEDAVTLKYARTAEQAYTHVKNGGFETNISADDWTFSQNGGSAVMGYDDTDSVEGSRSAMVTLTNGRGHLLQHVPISSSNATGQYKVSFWYRNTVAATGNNRPAIILLPEDESKNLTGALESQVLWAYFDPTTGTDWAYYEALLPEDAKHLNKPYLGIKVRIGGASANFTGQFWLDDVRVTPLSGYVAVTAITITGEDSVAAGKTLQLGADFTPADSFHTSVLHDLIWTLEGTPTTGTAISPGGLLTAGEAGTAKVRATWVYDPAVYAEKDIAIVARQLTLSVDNELSAAGNDGKLRLKTGEGRLLKGIDLSGVEFSIIEGGSFVELVTSPTTKKATLIASAPGTAKIKATYAAEGLSVEFEVVVSAAVYDDFDVVRRDVRNSYVLWNYDPSNPDVSDQIGTIKDTAEAMWTGMRNTTPDGGKRWGATNADRPWRIGDNNGTEDFWDDSSLYAYAKFMTQAFLYQASGETADGVNLYMNPDLLDDIISNMRWSLDYIYTGGTLSGGVYQDDGVYSSQGLPNPLREPVSRGQSASVYSNWFHRDIAMPKWSQQEMMMLYDWVPNSFVKEYTDRTRVYTRVNAARVTRSNSESLGSFTSGGEGTGNNADRALAKMYTGILAKDFNWLQGAATDMTGTRVITALGNAAGNGMKWDGSYIEHSYFPYAMGYGRSTLGGVGELMSYIAGKPFDGRQIAMNAAGLSRLEEIVENVFTPLFFRGVSMDNAAGRGISSGNEIARASQNMAAIYRAASGFSEPAKSRVMGNIKAWLRTRPELMNPADLDLAEKYKAIVDDPSLTANERTGLFARNWESRTYWNTGDYMFAISANSANAGNGMYEAMSANSGAYYENWKNIHSGDGMTYLYTADDPELYQGDFLATVDYRRLPGTTLEYKTSEIKSTAAHRNTKNIAGTGVLRDSEGVYAAAMFKQDLSGSALLQQNTTANKSWFMLGDKIIALGSGISQTGGQNQVETIADQRRLGKTGENAVLLNGATVTAAAGAGVSTGPNGATIWVQNTRGTGDPFSDSGVTAGGVGYYFAPDQSLSVGKATQEGYWGTANGVNTSSTMPVDKRTDYYASMFLNHGVNPANSTYEYVILPNRTQAQLQAFAAAPDYVVVKNESNLHAVYDTTLRTLAINSFANAPAAVTSPATGITYTVSRSAIVIIRELAGGTTEIAVQDPNGASDNIVVTVSDSALDSTTSRDNNIAVAQSGADITVTVSGLPSPENMKYNSWTATIKTVVTAPLIQHEVVFDVAGGNGTLTARVKNGPAIASGDQLDEGVAIEFTAAPATGYHVKAWTLNGGAVPDNTTNSYATILDRNVTVTVAFEPVTAKAVSVGTQSGALTAGTAGSADFTVTTTDIASGTAIVFHNDNNVAGISFSPVATTGSSTVITVHTTAATPQGIHTLAVTIDGVTSPTFALTVGDEGAILPPPPPPPPPLPPPPTSKRSSSAASGNVGNAARPNLPLHSPKDVAPTDAKSEAIKAAEGARASGQTSATVKFTNPANISLAALQAMAKEAGMPIRIHADSMSPSSNAVDVRIILDPSRSVTALNLSGATANDRARSVSAHFHKWFSNSLVALSLGQQGDFGQMVEIAVKLDPALNTDSLIFYSYDRTGNSFKQIKDIKYWVDANSYVHFTTEVAGDIIISDGPMIRRPNS